MFEDILSKGLENLNIVYPQDAISKLKRYSELLEEKNKVMNLTAISGEEDTVRLHFLDSAAFLTATDISGKTLIDVGTGAGFPGLVLKILRPDANIILLDSLDKRINFLKEVCEELDLKNVECIHARAEEIPKNMRESADFVTSRAVADLKILSELCIPYLKINGQFIALKGPDFEKELSGAKPLIGQLGGKYEDSIIYTIPETDINHSLLVIRKINTTPANFPRRWAQIKKPGGK